MSTRIQRRNPKINTRKENCFAGRMTMANHPSQLCRCCNGQGCSGWPIRPCPLCRGKGRITIRMARAIGWSPIKHRKRVLRPRNAELFA